MPKKAAQLPAAERRAMAAAGVDLTATTIIKTNSLFDSTDNCAKCLVKFSELVQQPEPRMDDWFDGALTVRQFLPGEQI